VEEGLAEDPEERLDTTTVDKVVKEGVGVLAATDDKLKEGVGVLAAIEDDVRTEEELTVDVGVLEATDADTAFDEELGVGCVLEALDCISDDELKLTPGVLVATREEIKEDEEGVLAGTADEAALEVCSDVLDAIEELGLGSGVLEAA
jgi:hypothetical protein